MNSKSKIGNFVRATGVAFVASAILIGSGFAANPGGEPSSMTVKFGDLNLGSDAGIATLYKRIHRAAEGVCALPDEGGSLEIRALELRCRAEAESRAVESVHSAALTAYFERRTGIRSPMVAMNGKR